jgi:hypothetical protein
MDPTKKQRVGYLVYFQGLDMGDFLNQDVQVFTPYSNATANYGEVTLDKDSGKATVVGVIESFSFGGGVGDPICISAYISAENAMNISAKLKTTLVTTTVKKLGWWICNFDEENKVWFEEAFPKDPTTLIGQLNAPGGKDIRLQVAAEATKIAPNVDVNVYNIYFEVVPAANSTYALHFASSAKTNFIRNWGLKVGTMAEAAAASA